MKKFVFIVLCLSIISIALCKDNSTDSKSSKKSNKKEPGFIARLLDKIISTITSVVSAPLKLTWSSIFGTILTPLTLPLKLITKAATKIQEIFDVFKSDVEQAMEKADEDLDGSSNKSGSNGTSGSNDKSGSDDKGGSSESKSGSDDNGGSSESKSGSDDKGGSSESKSESDDNGGSSESKSGSDDKGGSSESKSRRRRAPQQNSTQKILSNRRKRDTIENVSTPTSTFNIFTMSKKMFRKCYDLFIELLHKSDNIGNSINKILEKIFILLKYVKPVYLYFRDELLPSTVEQLIKAESSRYATKKVIHRVDNIKEGYKVLELLGYVPSLKTD